jgi:hypothetical protein
MVVYKEKKKKEKEKRRGAASPHRSFDDKTASFTVLLSTVRATISIPHSLSSICLISHSSKHKYSLGFLLRILKARVPPLLPHSSL